MSVCVVSVSSRISKPGEGDNVNRVLRAGPGVGNIFLAPSRSLVLSLDFPRYKMKAVFDLGKQDLNLVCHGILI